MDEKTVNVLVLIVVILIIISVVLLYGHIQHMREDAQWEYYVRFIRPKLERGRALGISDERLGELWVQAQNSVIDPTIVGGAPGAIFDDLIDYEVDKNG